MSTIQQQPPEFRSHSPLSKLQDDDIWSAGHTILFAILIFIGWVIVQFFATIPVILSYIDREDITLQSLTNNPDQLNNFATDGNAMSWIVLISGIGGIGLVWMFIAIKKNKIFFKYLKLHSTPAKHWLIWPAAVALYYGAMYLLQPYLNSDTLSSEMMDQIVASGDYVLLILAIGIIGPIWEELLFRGFIFRGFEHAGMNGHLNVLITSVLFVLIHIQYSWQIWVALLPIALLLGYARHYSQSLWIPIVMHIANNSLQVILMKSML